jgi:hypothetical protein
MHQRQTAGGDQALELLGGFALGYQQSPGHKLRIEPGPPGVKSTGTS